MGNNRKTGSDILSQPQALPIERDYVAEVQQRAEALAAQKKLWEDLFKEEE